MEDFKAIKADIKKLNKINPHANNSENRRYFNLYDSIYERLLEMEKNGRIVKQPGNKDLSYLDKLAKNDGPEYCYTIIFWEKGHPLRKYKIGVCVRGLPICKPYNRILFT